MACVVPGRRGLRRDAQEHRGRAKTRAVKESIETGLDVALTVPLLAAAVEDEYRETRDSMADVDPEQWSRINGMDPIRRIRTAE